MPNEFIVKNGLVVGGNVVTSGTITINGALAATQSWVTSQAYLTSANLSGYATQSYVTSALAALVDAAPAALDTLNELAAALGDDASFSTTITNSIAGKVAKSGDTMTGDLTLNYGYPRINFYDSGNNPDYSLINNDGDFSLYDITNNVHRLWVSAGGNVGIGTTAPTSNLHISGTGDQSITLQSTTTASSQSSYIKYIRLTTGSSRTWWTGIGIQGGSDDSYSFYDQTAAAERMRITAAGNVGIGTTNPTHRLTIAGGNVLMFPSDNTRQLSFFNDSYGITASSGLELITGDYIRFRQGSTELARLTTTGLGIGTTSPGSKLDVAGYINIFTGNGLRWGSGDAEIINSGYNLLFKTYNGSALAEAMRINTAGKVAIGTTDTNSDKSDFTVYTGSGASLALVDDQVRMGSTDVNWGVALRSTGYLETYGQALYLQSVAGNHPVVVRPNNTSSVEFYSDYTLFNGLNLSISRINSVHAANYFRGDTSHLVIGTGGTLYLNYANTSGTTYIYGTTYINNNVVWHAGNDGSGSGLDADLLDGQQGSYYQAASTAITTSNIGSQSVSYANSAGYAGYVNNQSGQLLRYDNRTISPSETTAGYLQFGFTSWANDNSGPYADYLHMRSYTDGSGGNDNLVMFLKSGIGMRIYQQTFGSATAYSSYADVWHSGNLTNLNQLTNGPGYITGYTETDTLNSVTGRGNTTGNNIITSANVYASIFYDYNDNGYYLDPNGNSVLTTATFNVNASSTLILTSAGTNASQIKAGAGDELYLGGNNTWQMRFNSGNVLMDNGGYLQNNESLRAPIFYDSNDTNYYIDPNSTSNINNLSVVGYQSIGGQTSNGQSNYQWDGATYRNPDQWTARLILRRDNATTGINGSIPSLVIFNNNGADQTTASMVFATNECVTGSNSVNLAGIIAKKESVGNCGGWSSGSLNFFVKNFGARVDSLALTPDGNATFSGLVYSTGYGNSSQWNTAYSWGNHASAGYLTSYSETDTLASVTGRGASTSTAVTFNGGVNLAANTGIRKSGDNWIIGYDTSLPGIAIGSGTATDKVSISAGGTQRVWFDTNGRVGIGTATPAEELHVIGRGIFNGGSGNSSTDAVVYITKSTNDDWGLYVNNAGLDYGMYTRVSPSAGYAFAIHNGTNWTTRITGDGRIYLNEKDTIASYDTWLRLNQSGHYGSGVYTPGVMRADGGFNVSGSTVWHAGNDGSGSGLDADTVDGVQADSIVYGNARGTNQSITNNNNDLDKTGYYTADGFTTKPSGVANWMYIEHIKLYNDNTAYQKQLGYDTYDDRMWVRTKSGGAWSSWKQIWTSDVFANNSSNWNTAYGWGNHASASYATTSYVTTQINNLINGAPGVLDTLDELAAALGDDANFATTVTNSIAGKVSKAGDVITTANQYGLVINHTPVLGDFVDALLLRSSTSGQRAQIGFATVDADGDHHRASIRAYKGPGTLEGAFGIALRQAGSGAHIQRFTLDYLGNVTIGGFLTESSSLKLKENVETSEGNLEKVVNLRPVTFNKIGSQTTELGLIAEEVAEVYPEFVQYDENGEPIGVNYSRLTAALIGAVKELNEQLQELKRNK